ncbi:MAG: hypothetical protein ACE5I7_16530 [Candidatus Binatia bacterium]
MRHRCWVALGLLLAATPALAQVRFENFGTSGRINVTYTEPSDEGQATRLQELAATLKPLADQLHPLEEINIVIVHSRRELEQRLGPGHDGALAGVSYIHGILFLSPIVWQTNPTQEALEQQMKDALVRYAVLFLSGGNRLPGWLDQGLVSFLTQRTFGVGTAEPVARAAPLLLARREAAELAVGYWAVRYLAEERGGLPVLQQLLRLHARRPDTFVEDLELTYGVSVGELERDWRQWLAAMVERDKRERESGVREGPLVRDPD